MERKVFIFLSAFYICTIALCLLLVHYEYVVIVIPEDEKLDTTIADIEIGDSPQTPVDGCSSLDSEGTECPLSKLNNRPIIGILSQELSRGMQRVFGDKNYTSYIAASYVKFVESAGARVVPVLINRTDEYYMKMGGSLNGFLFPGGSLYYDSLYSSTVKRILEIVKNTSSKNPPAIWATCLGFENLVYFESGMNTKATVECNATNTADPLKFRPGYEKSQLFQSIPKFIIEALSTKNITSNFHKYCTLPKDFNDIGLNESYRILSTSKDRNGVEYVSTIEHSDKPIFGTQWHPEKAAFEWADDPKHNSIPHSIDAIQASQSLAEVFIQTARLNTNKFDSKGEEMNHLIYNFSPMFVAREYNSSFQICYYFD